jgi:uncharacterized protein involved in exopolysaccharide biosynthesis
MKPISDVQDPAASGAGSAMTPEVSRFAAEYPRGRRDPTEVTVADLFALLRRGRWLIVAITGLMTAGALCASLLLPKHYEATVLVSAVSRRSGGSGIGGMGSMLSSLGGLASLVGLSSSANASRAQDIATLKSQVLTQRYISEHQLLPILFAKKWNPAAHSWRTKKVPTLWDGNRYFKEKVRSVTEDAKTGLIRVTVTWTDPDLAAQWANGIVKMTNDYLRTKAIDEANRDIAYLQRQADKTTEVEVKQAIYSLMQQEIRNAMIAKGEHEYALKVIDPAFVPEKPSSPKPLLWTIAGFLAGLATSLGALIVRENWCASA